MRSVAILQLLFVNTLGIYNPLTDMTTVECYKSLQEATGKPPLDADIATSLDFGGTSVPKVQLVRENDNKVLEEISGSGLQSKFLVLPRCCLDGFYTVRYEAEVGKLIKCYFQTKLPVSASIMRVTGQTFSHPIFPTDEQWFPELNEIHVTGKESLNFNEKDVLSYQWSCTHKIDLSEKFCKAGVMEVQSEFRIPARFVKKYDEIIVTLQVTAGGRSDKSTSKFLVEDTNILKMQVGCLNNNCFDKRNLPSGQRNITLVAKCDDCKNIFEQNSIEKAWAVESPNMNRVVARGTTEYDIPANFLETDALSSITFTAHYDESTHAAYHSVTFPILAPPKTKSCSINPSMGISLETKFSFQCEMVKWRPYHYELLHEDGKVILRGYSPYIFKETFLLPEMKGKKIIGKIYELNEASTEFSLSADVKPKPKTTTTTTTPPPNDLAYNNIKNNLFDNKTKAKAINDLHDLTQQVTKNDKDHKDDQFMKTFKQNVSDDMLKIKPDNIDQVDKLTELYTGLMAHDEANDVSSQKLTTNICRKLAQDNIDVVKREKDPLQFANQTKRIASLLANCSFVNSKLDKNIPTLPVDGINFTTLPPPKEEEHVAEHYDDYEEKVYNKSYVRTLEESTSNIINTTMMALKGMALATPIGEESKKAMGSNTIFMVKKDYGSKLAGKELTCQNVALVPSDDFLLESNHSFDILLSAWKDNPMWWSETRINLATDIASVQFWHSTCTQRITKFKKPFQITFNVTRNITRKILESKIKISEDINKVISVHRVTFQKELWLRIAFYNLSKTDIFDVVLTKFKYPVIEDFSSNRSISFKNNFLEYQGDDDGWWYLGVLPNQNMGIKNVSYFVSFQSSGCVRWHKIYREWQQACIMVTGRRNIISCNCTESSVFAAYLEDLVVIPQDFQELQFNLELKPCYAIFSTVAFIFSVYCSLITFTVIRHKQRIYYLADNLKNDLFGYMIIVRTSALENSGTTSIVGIKVFGTNGASKPHILNIPDPNSRILQNRCDDLFILTEADHLGQVTMIHLWHNGFDYCRRCDDIIIFDMQGKQQWYFDVNTFFSITQGTTFLALAPVSAKAPKTRLQKLNVCNEYHTWNLWMTEDNFSYTKKLTVLLSTINTTLCSIAISFGVPELKNRDCLDQYDLYRIDFFTFWIGIVCSLCCYTIHILISYTFRNSEVKYYRSGQENAYFGIWVTDICWAVLMILTIVSMCYLIFCGFWIPRISSFCCLTSCGIGLLCDILIYENVVVLLRNFTVKSTTPTTFSVGKYSEQFFNILLDAIETQRKLLYKSLGSTLLREYFQGFYELLTPRQIGIKSMAYAVRKYLVEDARDLLMFAIYVVMLYVVIWVGKDSYLRNSKANIEDLVKGIHTKSIGFSQITDIRTVYEYINHTLIPLVQPIAWYHNYSIAEPGLMIDVNNKILGVVQIRQHRMRENVCAVAEPMKFLEMSCWPEFSYGRVEKRSFGYGWGEITPEFSQERLRSIWEYRSENGTPPIKGEINSYPRGAYVAFLGRTLYNSRLNLNKVFTKSWLDQKTRSLVVEFITYNANHNVFNAIRLLLEQSASGYINRLVTVQPVRLIFVEGEMERITFIAFFLFIIWVFVLTMNKSITFIKRIKTFYKDAWLMVDLCIMSISFVCIYLMMLRAQMVGEYMKILERAQHNLFVSYFDVFDVEYLYTIIAAALVCISTIRLWKILRFGKVFREMEKALVMALPSLLSLSLCFMVLLISFAFYTVMLYGNDNKKFRDFKTSIETLMIMTLNLQIIDSGRFASKHSSVYIIVTLYTISMLILLFFYITFIATEYENATRELSIEDTNYTLKNYLLDQLKDITKSVSQKFTRLRGGKGKKIWVTPKPDDFYFEECFTITKKGIEMMKWIALRILRKKKQIDPRKSTNMQTMLGVANCSVIDTDKTLERDVFFKGTVGLKKYLVNIKRIEMVAAITEQILSEETVGPTKPKKQEFLICCKYVKKNQSILRTCEKYLMDIEVRLDNCLKLY